jgi:hypothetical protein
MKVYGFYIGSWIYWTHYGSWLHFTDHHHTQTRVLSHVAWQWLPMVGVPVLPGSLASGWRPYHAYIIFWPLASAVSSRAGLTSSCQPQLQLSILNWLPSRTNSQVGRSVKMLLAFVSTVIPGFSLLKIHDQYFYSLLDLYVFRNGASSLTKEESVFLCRCYVCCTIVSARV